MRKLGLHLSSAAGTLWVCTGTAFGGILGKGVRVCVCVYYVPSQTACEDVLVSVQPTPPSVCVEQNTYVIQKMSHIIPSPLSFKSISNLFFKQEYSVLIAAPGRSLIACKVWKSQKHRHLQPPLLMLHVWKFLSASPVVIFEYLFSAPPIRAHQSEWEASSPPRCRAVCSDPALLYSDRGFQKLTCRGHTTQGTMGLRHISCLDYSTWMRFHYLGKKENNGDKQDQ